ncbi:ATP-binding cassette, subfamily B [Fictibacillus enclensis]|uniref:Multidrug ABC transporter ATP-binding protein n=1 Tax=Fictibacillus enclensis TaxID=1017270 RepID=A0A0V8J2I4_9BACL|nr:ABC transporter ATP-binding protein [Fictibacillus enclensis]KSU80960.1 multidrug ABC transporter ATP-binding protein [Fictibacillus enclensis]SCC33490.1 ATP-binding cassette, subfamily B [Fictibacillus enclensis]
MLKDLIEPFRHKREVVQEVLEKEPPAKKKVEKAKDWQGTLRQIWIYLAREKGRLWLVLLMVVLSSVFGLLGPFMIGKAIDNYIITRDNSGLLRLLAGLLGVYVLNSVALWFQNYWMIGIAQNTVFSMRTQLFRHLHKLPIPFFDKRQYGEIMSRVINDIENVSSTLNSSVIQIISSVLTLFGTIGFMLWLSPLLTAVTLVIVPVMFLGMRWITKRTGKLFKLQQRNLGELNGFIEETISGQRIVKAFSQEDRVIAELLKKNDKLKESGFWAQTYSGFIPKLMNVLNNISFALIAGAGGFLALKGLVTIGTIVIFAEYSRQFTRPLNDLSNQFNTLLSAVAGAERVFEILEEEEEEKDEEGHKELGEVRGEIEFVDVSFSYEEGGNTVSQISFHAAPGESVALVGPTGAGKTTIINLLSRFYDTDSGTILLDGRDIKSIKREALRAQMGFVLQDPFLFEGTIMENIRYGRLEARDEEVVKAAKEANAHSFITKLPNGYDTVIEQDGSGISQGQKQLLSIARAILANPVILVLDEATSSIDTITEMKIQEALQRLMKGKTSFIIAHRLNTIQKADQILVLNDGGILEKGSHQQLLKENGYYSELYHSQLQKEIG